MKAKKTHGGKRKGAGRKQSEVETTIISFRVPTAKAEILKEKIRKIIEKS